MGEWLLANGLGGYGLGPRSGPPTRGYHGWLIAATTPPDGRRLMVGAIETTAIIDDASTGSMSSSSRQAWRRATASRSASRRGCRATRTRSSSAG